MPLNGKDKEQAKVCYLPQVPRWFPRVRQLFTMWEKGVMLRPGSAAAQPAWYLQAMSAFGSIRDEFVNARMLRDQENRAAAARAKAMAKRGGRG